MTKKKLTLRMREKAISRAKDYARRRGTSVSRLVENFFSALEDEHKRPDIEPSALVEELAGLATDGEDVTEEDYYDYLEEKYR